MLKSWRRSTIAQKIPANRWPGFLFFETSEGIREVLLRATQHSALIASELCADHLIKDTLASEERRL